jgi:CelD/BcsL family acetyltransferase involved in cellulose biosynthesis
MCGTENKSLCVSIITDFNSIANLRKEWQDLLEGSPSPNIFLTWEWISNWWKWFGYGRELKLMIVKEGGRPKAILPLYIDRVSFIPGLRLNILKYVGDGGPVFPDYLRPILDDNMQNCIPILAENLLETGKQCDLIQLSAMREDASEGNDLLEKIGAQYIIEEEDDLVSPFATLPSDYESFLRGLSRRRRESTRRKLRKAKKAFRVRLECFSSTDTIENAFLILSRIYNKSLRGLEQREGFARPDYLRFHKDIAHAFAKKGWLRLFVLWFDETPVAYIYGYFFAQKYWYYQTAFDLAYSKYGAGMVAIQMVIESMIQEGAREFDFLRGNEAYKYFFSNGEYKMRNLFLFRKRGIAYGTYQLRRFISESKNRFLDKKRGAFKRIDDIFRFNQGS